LFKFQALLFLKKEKRNTKFVYGFAITLMYINAVYYAVYCSLPALFCIGRGGGLRIRLSSVSSHSGQAIHADWLDMDLLRIVFIEMMI